MERDPSKNSERLDLLTSETQARELHSLGDRPVMVLTQSPSWRMVPGLSEPLAIKLEDESQRMQKSAYDFRVMPGNGSRSSRGTICQMRTPNSGSRA